MTFPVAHPTWYDTIRQTFTATDISHMSKQGLDLTSYEQVRASAGAVYGQVSAKTMPPRQPWTQDMIQTLLNWMTGGYPKGTAPSTQTSGTPADRATSSIATRIRKDVNALSDAERAVVKKAFEGIKAHGCSTRAANSCDSG